MAKRSVKSWLQNAALAVASSMLALLAGEALVRLVAPPPPEVYIETRRDQDQVGPAELQLERVPDAGGLFMTSPSGVRLRPNTHAILRHERLSGGTIDIRTNSLGYRGPEVSSGSGMRILFLGDSITFANYLPEEQTFVRLVGDFGRQMGHAWNTINTGVGAIGLANEVAILQESGLSVRPDVVVLDFYLNDFLESPGVFMVSPPPILSWSWAARYAAMRFGRYERREWTAAIEEEIEAEVKRRLHPGPGNWKHDRQAFEAIAVQWWQDWGGGWSPAAWRLMAPLLRELKRLSEAHGFTLVFVAFPVSYQVEADFVEDWPQRQLIAIGRDLDVPVLDLLPSLRVAVSEGPLFYDQCHHTELGSRVVAQAIADFLVAHVPARVGL